jgi:hypothetical protein
MRITSAGVALFGSSVTPTKATAGSIKADGLFLGPGAVSQAGRNQVYVGDFSGITASTGTVVFNFKSLQPTQGRACFVKLSVMHRPGNNNTASNLPAAEYWFHLFHTSVGVCSLNNPVTQFEYTYVYATHFAFANLGNGECTVTLTNPTASLQTNGSYKVEILDPSGVIYLDTVTTT